jgi:hypothetical protein
MSKTIVNQCHNFQSAIYVYMKINIKGEWIKQGNEYKSALQTVSIVIGTRKRRTENKPPQYLLLKLSPSKFEYLSGLFPTSEKGIYTIDWGDKDYRLNFIDSTKFKIE